MKTLLEKLQIKATNAGACIGPDGWIEDTHGTPLVSYNPTTNQPIATVIQASTATLNTVVTATQHAFQTWRLWPAPKSQLNWRLRPLLYRARPVPAGGRRRADACHAQGRAAGTVDRTHG